jgi:hypothetical protein
MFSRWIVTNITSASVTTFLAFLAGIISWSVYCTWTAASNGPHVHPPDYKWFWRAMVELFTGQNRRTQRKAYPSATLSTTNRTWTDPGANPVFRGQRPVTNRLSHGKAERQSSYYFKTHIPIRLGPHHFTETRNWIMSATRTRRKLNFSCMWVSVELHNLFSSPNVIRQIQWKTEVDMACGTHGRGEKSLHGFGGKDRRKETTRKTEAYMAGWDLKGS